MDLQPSHYHPTPQKLNLLSSPIFTKKDLSYSLLFLSLLIISITFNKIITPGHPQSLLGINFLYQILPKTQNSTPKICDYSNGRWVWDESYQLGKYTENCPFLDPGFRCRKSGRKDMDFLKWRWQPEGCDLPRFNATRFLEMSRNGLIVFAGDSIGRNQWESLICMLSQGVSNKSTIYEENGNPITKHKGYLSIRFAEYKLTVQYYRAPFLVLIGRPPPNAPKEVQTTLKLDKLHWYSAKWAEADVLVFSAGHWWNQEKTVKMGCYFQEGQTVNMTMNVIEAFQRSIHTWKAWAMENLDQQRSHIFFRSYSPVHYRDGTWNEGGHCHTNMAPETNYTKLEPEPTNNLFISEVLKQMGGAKRKVEFLNITYLTEFRKDGHPSRHREPGTPVPAPQDCSHWCLPGVPDTWNELLYAQLLSNGF